MSCNPMCLAIDNGGCSQRKQCSDSVEPANASTKERKAVELCEMCVLKQRLLSLMGALQCRANHSMPHPTGHCMGFGRVCSIG
eukprot:1439549-Amphidinium_carterae.1